MRQKNTQTDSFDESSLLMIPAELTDRVDDPIHLLERHSIHLLVEFIEVCANLLIIIGIVFIVALVEHGQDRISVTEVWRIFCDVGSQFLKIDFQINHLQSVGDVTSDSPKAQVAKVTKSL